MTKEEILNRIEQIITISKQKSNVPPVHLVLAIDGNLILEDLYDEYEKLIKTKIVNKYHTEKEKSKLEQLSYIKDKLTFLENKAKNSKNSISILSDDISEYSDALNLFNDLSKELNIIINPPFDETSIDDNEENSNIKEKNIDIESIVALPLSKKVSISLEDSDFRQNNTSKKNNKDNNKNSSKNNLFQVLDIPSSKQPTIKQEVNPSNNILNDLADIDKILNNINLSNESISPRSDSHSKFYIGTVVTPTSNVISYNDPSVIANKDSLYRIVSFVALDKDDNVISSSNVLGTSFRSFSDDNPQASLYFILAKTDDANIDTKEWSNRSISIDLPNCIGSFSSFSSFIPLASTSSV